MRFFLNFLAVGAAGFLGAVLRWLISLALNDRGPLPWGTLLINVGGSFLLGWFMAAARDRVDIPEALKLAVAVGFIGTFTTFSTFMYETNSKLEAGGGTSWLGMMYLAVSIVLGLVAVKIGMAVGHPQA